MISNAIFAKVGGRLNSTIQAFYEIQDGTDGNCISSAATVIIVRTDATLPISHKHGRKICQLSLSMSLRQRWVDQGTFISDEESTGGGM